MASSSGTNRTFVQEKRSTHSKSSHWNPTVFLKISYTFLDYKPGCRSLLSDRTTWFQESFYILSWIFWSGLQTSCSKTAIGTLWKDKTVLLLWCIDNCIGIVCKSAVNWLLGNQVVIELGSKTVSNKSSE